MVLRSVLAATLTGALVGLLGAPAQAAPALTQTQAAPGAMRAGSGVPAGSGDIGLAAAPLDAANFRLRASSYNELIDDLDNRLPVVDVPTVVADGNRNGTSCTPNAAHLVAAFCWDLADDIAPYWFPQGITTSADAEAAGTYQGATAILVSWYDNGSDGVNRGVRISFVDRSTSATPTYRHVLLVEPYTRADGWPDFRPIDIHAGGIFWYGHYLYVVSTHSGFQVFDLRHIWQTDTSDDRAIGLRPDGSYQAFGYKYVLPQVFTYTQSTAGGYANLRFSFTSLDRTSTPHSVVVGEYSYFGGGTRLVRFPIDQTTRLLTADSDGFVRGIEAHGVSAARMQGAAAINGKYLLSLGDSLLGRGELGVFRPGGSVVKHSNVLPAGPEDLSYWAGRDQLWSLTEYPSGRSVFAIRASAY